MSKAILSIDTESDRTAENFHPREFKRILSACCRYRGMLVLGLLATVVFAGLHTFSISGAFPVFKLLLEEEGLYGWTQRTLACQRLGGTMGPPDAEGVVRVLRVERRGPLADSGIEVGDRLWDPDRRAAEVWMAETVQADPGQPVRLHTDARSESHTATADQPLVLELTPAALNWPWTWAGWGAARLPPDFDDHPMRVLRLLLIGLVGLVIVANVFRYLGEVLIARSVLRSMRDLRAEVYAKALRLPMAFYAGTTTSDLVGRLVQDVQEIQRGMLTLFSKFLREPFRAVFILGLALLLDWRLTLTVMLVAPLVILLFWQVGKRVKRSNRQLLQAYGQMIGALTASLQNLRVVKAYTAESHEQRRLREVDERVLQQQVKLARLQAFVSPALETVAVIAASLLLLWLSARVLNQQISMSRFAALGVTLGVLFDPLRKLTDVYVRVLRASAGAERVFQILDQPAEAQTAAPGATLGPLSEGLTFDDVTFTYPGAARPALIDVRLTIRKGETVAIVGPNGSGKTTLVSLLPRFFDPDEGAVRYDGVDLREADLVSLRRQIGLVTQDAIVFAGTPLENIAYGGDPNPDAALDAARRAFADEFIRQIEGGYEAALGERGTTLSGGQRQRLAIARAIFRNAPVLIFDEATSQVDTESEGKIQQAVGEFSRGRTTLIIAHRMSTIQHADRIVVMEAGRIIDEGTHAVLFSRCPLYRTLCETQFVSETRPADRPAPATADRGG